MSKPQEKREIFSIGLDSYPSDPNSSEYLVRAPGLISAERAITGAYMRGITDVILLGNFDPFAYNRDYQNLSGESLSIDLVNEGSLADDVHALKKRTNLSRKLLGLEVYHPDFREASVQRVFGSIFGINVAIQFIPIDTQRSGINLVTRRKIDRQEVIDNTFLRLLFRGIGANDDAEREKRLNSRFNLPANRLRNRRLIKTP